MNHPSTDTQSLPASPDDRPAAAQQPLGRYAAQLASATRIDPSARRSRRHDLIARFKKNAKQIRSVNSTLRQNLSRGEFVPPEADWIVDNYFVIEEQLQEIATDLPPGYLNELPRISGGDPRIYRIAQEIISRSDAALDETIISDFLQHYQKVQVLTIGESWAFPIMLRMTLVEQLRQHADAIVDAQRARAAAIAVRQSYRDRGVIALDGSRLVWVAPWLSAIAEQDPDDDSTALIADLAQSLRRHGWKLADVVRLHHQRNASAQLALANIITSMRLMGMIDWSVFVEDHNVAEQTLRKDPLGVYSAMDPISRNRYRTAVESISRRSPLEDFRIAAAALELARAGDVASDYQIERHVGYWLLDEGRQRLEVKCRFEPKLIERLQRWAVAHPHVFFFGQIATVTLAAVLLFCWAIAADVAWYWWVALLPPLAVAASELGVQLANWVVTQFIPIRPLPKLELETELPEGHPTIVVVPCLFGSTREIDTLLARLENHYLSNPVEALKFALLSDFTDAQTETTPKDETLLSHAATQLTALNARYGGQRFMILHRRRRHNAAEGCYMGWERKRGKLMQFGRWLLGNDEPDFIFAAGGIDELSEFRRPEKSPFVITLDADTQLPHGAALSLVGTLAHPLNRPIWDHRQHRISRGYVVLQPRVAIDLASRMKSRFAAIYSTGAGINPYVVAASDVYQDLFGEGSFTGKGVYDLKVFEHALQGAFPENTILSHDLIEGAHTRVAMASDVEVFDGYPARYDADAKRNHRWVRGDWQILPWLFGVVPSLDGPRANRINALSKWKIFDNLRRSVVPAAIVIAAAIVWIAWPSKSAAVVLAGLAAIGYFVPLLSAVMASYFKPRQLRWGDHLQAVLGGFARSVRLATFEFVTLPHRAYFMLDAIVRTLYRTTISHRNRLQWQTAAAVELSKGDSTVAMWLKLSAGPLLAIALLLAMPAASALFVSPLLAAWLLSPAIVGALSRPRRDVDPREEINDVEAAYLLRVARRTWSYFENYVTEQHHYLPPDNVQEVAGVKVAARISPTNQGLFQLSAMAAFDFGFISLLAVVRLWHANWHAWKSLPTHKGHYFNWYGTEDLAPLPPRYISTVDSGNLAACLLAWHSALDELPDRPLLSRERFGGWLATVECVQEDLRRAAFGQRQDGIDGEDAAIAAELLGGADQASDILRKAIAGQAVVPAIDLLRETEGVFEELRRLLLTPMRAIEEGVRTEWLRARFAVCRKAFEGFRDELAWLHAATDTPALAQLATAELTLRRIAAADAAGRPTAAPAIAEAAEMMRLLETMASEAEAAFEAMDFKFLFNRRRKLLTIGYNLESDRRDRSHYDMLCSESRIGSYVAIAKGDLPPVHWARLGRKMTYAARSLTLVSWGGTMFEFLMPPLLQRHYERSLLTTSAETAIARQIEYASKLGVPWGISESAYSSLNSLGDYQYQSFGVPGLGLKPGLHNDLVIAPYATLLSCELRPRASIDNLRRLEACDALGPWGFYDAVDFTASRLPAGKSFAVVRNYMAHHHGMSILAIHNLLLGGATQDRFARHRIARSCELLLQEKYPQAVVRSDDLVDAASEPAVAMPSSGIVVRRMERLNTLRPRMAWIGNANYSVCLSHTGCGSSRWQDQEVLRGGSFTRSDPRGVFFFLRRQGSENWFSPTYLPLATNSERASCTFAIDKAEFFNAYDGLEAELDVTVSPEHDAEVRRLRLTNTTEQDIVVDAMSYAEIALAPEAADEAHPAFSKLFIETEIRPDMQAIYARRRPRDANDQPLHAAAVLLCEDGPPQRVSYTTSREAFIGRNRSLADAAALEHPELDGADGVTFDPIFGFSARLIVPAGQTRTLTVSFAIARSAEMLDALVESYRDSRTTSRSFELSWVFHQSQLRDLSIDSAAAHQYQVLGSYLAIPSAAMRTDMTAARGAAMSQSDLWPLGISGDLPILLVNVVSEEEIPAVMNLCRGHAYLQTMGMAFDLVLVNENAGGYRDDVAEMLTGLRNKYNGATGAGGQIHLLSRTALSEQSRQVLQSVAAISMHAADGSLSGHITRAIAAEKSALEHMLGETFLPVRMLYAKRFATALVRAADPPNQAWVADLGRHSFDNGFGYFADDGGYVIDRTGDRPTPAPWAMILSNQRFGTLVTEAGGGYSWYGNSREYKISRWSNDPVVDPPGERLWVTSPKDEAAVEPLRAAEVVGYAWGIARYQSRLLDCLIDTEVWVDCIDPVKIVRVQLTNTTDLPRTYVLTYALPLMLADHGRPGRGLITTAIDDPPGTIYGENRYHPDFGDASVFLAVDGEDVSVSGSYRGFEFYRQSIVPLAIEADSLDGIVGRDSQPALAVRCRVVVGPHQTLRRTIRLGGDEHRTAARALALNTADPGYAEASRQRTIQYWKTTACPIELKSTYPDLDRLVNGWLLYQTVACRMFARTAFYQCGGAYGFRDQLQDAMAAALSTPPLLHQQILRAAAQQFEEGDVQHWWHPPSNRGTRTRFSDDLLFLPLAVLRYLELTDDLSLLKTPTPYLRSPVLKENEHERYETPLRSGRTASILKHCIDAIDLAVRRTGPHGLPLIGGGDWNDGMNAIGVDGRGESVWLAWFLRQLLLPFAELLSRVEAQTGLLTDLSATQISQRAELYRNHAAALYEAIQTHGWDGDWYLRAYFDDGRPLGSHRNQECQIDALPQAFAAKDPQGGARAAKAVRTTIDKLFDRNRGLTRLFTPPLTADGPPAGYINAYPPGIRENGGQYTHGVLWLIQAAIETGEVDDALAMLRGCLPTSHSLQPDQAQRYRLEPYVVAADIYTHPQHYGRGGWSWYTGAAGWAYRTIVEWLFGIQRRGSSLRVQPRLPAGWGEFELTLNPHDDSPLTIFCEEHSSDRASVAFGEWFEPSDYAGRRILIAPPRQGE